jgi:GLPGLI family protein
MKNKIIMLATSLFIFTTTILAQEDFMSKGVVQYEVKMNNHKNFMNDEGEDNSWYEQMKEFVPKISTYFYTLKFADNKSIFQYKDKVVTPQKMWGEDEFEDNVWYFDYEKGISTKQKNIFSEVYKLEDSIKKIKWKLLPNENREFIGFNCKKAMGVLYDSVYIFAYYTDAITISGGPMSINGLPGLIMGLTIPRLNFSCIATTFTPLVTESDIVAPKKGKVRPPTELYNRLKERTKDWGKYGQKAIWQSFL